METTYPQNISYDELWNFIDEMDFPAQRYGFINVVINNKGKVYSFNRLKPNFSRNPDSCGFGLNHYNFFEDTVKQAYKSSQFHDMEDVSIDIDRDKFVSAQFINGNELRIRMKTWTADVYIKN